MSKHRLRKRYGHHRYSHSSHSLTFGVLPPFDEFQHHIESGVDDEGRRYLAAGTKYPIEAAESDRRVLDALRVKPSGVGDYGKAKYEFTAKQLYALIKKLMQKADATRDDEMRESAEGLASAIMGTLGYEWI
jgi:hypothetical protein